MDWKAQLQNLFPDNDPDSNNDAGQDMHEAAHELWMQEEPILCKYEKRRGKIITILEGYTGDTEDFKKLTKLLQTKLGVGGSHKREQIIIQGDYREQIMQILTEKGFKAKRVGG